MIEGEPQNYGFYGTEFDGDEGASFDTGDTELTEAEKEEWNKFLIDGLKEEVRRDDVVAQNCRYIVFLSNSKGRSRRRKRPEIVELVRYGGRCRLIINGDWGNKIDEIASEVLGDSVRPGEAAEIFLDRLRKLRA